MRSTMDAKLVVVAGKTSQSEIRLKRLPFSIGRSKTASLPVPDNAVSREHCVLYEHEGAICIRDYGSANGTFVNAKSVSEAVVKPGDRVTVGPLTFLVVYPKPLQFPTEFPSHEIRATRSVAVAEEEWIPIVDDEDHAVDLKAIASSKPPKGKGAANTKSTGKAAPVDSGPPTPAVSATFPTDDTGAAPAFATPPLGTPPVQAPPVAKALPVAQAITPGAPVATAVPTAKVVPTAKPVPVAQALPVAQAVSGAAGAPIAKALPVAKATPPAPPGVPGPPSIPSPPPAPWAGNPFPQALPPASPPGAGGSTPPGAAPPFIPSPPFIPTPAAPPVAAAPPKPLPTAKAIPPATPVAPAAPSPVAKAPPPAKPLPEAKPLPAAKPTTPPPPVAAPAAKSAAEAAPQPQLAKQPVPAWGNGGKPSQAPLLGLPKGRPNFPKPPMVESGPLIPQSAADEAADLKAPADDGPDFDFTDAERSKGPGGDTPSSFPSQEPSGRLQWEETPAPMMRPAEVPESVEEDYDNALEADAARAARESAEMDAEDARENAAAEAAEAAEPLLDVDAIEFETLAAASLDENARDSLVFESAAPGKAPPAAAVYELGLEDLADESVILNATPFQPATLPNFGFKAQGGSGGPIQPSRPPEAFPFGPAAEEDASSSVSASSLSVNTLTAGLMGGAAGTKFPPPPSNFGDDAFAFAPPGEAPSAKPASPARPGVPPPPIGSAPPAAPAAAAVNTKAAPPPPSPAPTADKKGSKLPAVFTFNAIEDDEPSAYIVGNTPGFPFSPPPPAPKIPPPKASGAMPPPAPIDAPELEAMADLEALALDAALTEDATSASFEGPPIWTRPASMQGERKEGKPSSVRPDDPASFFEQLAATYPGSSLSVASGIGAPGIRPPEPESATPAGPPSALLDVDATDASPSDAPLLAGAESQLGSPSMVAEWAEASSRGESEPMFGDAPSPISAPPPITNPLASVPPPPFASKPKGKDGAGPGSIADLADPDLFVPLPNPQADDEETHVAMLAPSGQPPRGFRTTRDAPVELATRTGRSSSPPGPSSAPPGASVSSSPPLAIRLLLRDASLVTVGTKVKAAGIEVGKVFEVGWSEYEDELCAEAVLHLDRKLAPPLRSDARLAVQGAAAGTAWVAIIGPGKKGAPVEPDQQLRSTEFPAG